MSTTLFAQSSTLSLTLTKFIDGYAPRTVWYTLAILVLMAPVLNWLLKWKEFIDLVNKIPGPPGNFLIGNADIVLYVDRKRPRHGLSVYMFAFLTAMRVVFHKARICRIWLGFRPIFILFTPEGAEAVLSSNTLINKADEYKFLGSWLGEGLITSNSNKWKMRRKLLTPAFHFRILGDFMPIFNEQSVILVNKINQNLDKDWIDIVPLLTLCTLDIICESSMGVKINAQKNSESEYIKSLHYVTGSFVLRIMRPWLWPDFLFYRSSYGKRYKECLTCMKEFTREVIRDRKKDVLENLEALAGKLKPGSDMLESCIYNGKRRLAFMDLVLYYHLVDNSLTEEDVREEVDTFMFAGHDTTAMTLSWMFYLLGLYPDVQKKVQEELDSIFGNDRDRPVTLDDLKQMRYLDLVFKEVQRIYPTAPMVGRELHEDINVNGYYIPKGGKAFVFTYLLHRNPHIYPNPEVFDPERFLPENTAGRHPYAYIPFSAGQRNCIGQKYAIMEVKVIVATVLRHFSIKSLDQRDKLYLVAEMILRPKYGIRLKFTPRDATKSAVNNKIE